MYTTCKINLKYSNILFVVFCLLLTMLFSVYIVCNAFAASSIKINTINGSSFLEKIYNEFQTADIVPKGDQLFIWDFSNKKKLDFQYSKKSIVTESINNDDKSKTIIESDGIMVINSRGDNTASLELNNIESVIMEGNSKGGVEKDPLKVTAPPLVISNIKEDGSVSNKVSSHELFLNMLFLLPHKSLNVGEQSKIKRSYNIREAGTAYTVYNETITTFKRYVKFGDRICAELESEIFIKKEKSDTAGADDSDTYSSAINGKMVFLFDVDRRLVVFGKAAAIVNVHIDQSINRKHINQKNNMSTNIINDNFISFSLRKNGVTH